LFDRRGVWLFGHFTSHQFAALIAWVVVDQIQALLFFCSLGAALTRKDGRPG
jgi:hypothetical protein